MSASYPKSVLAKSCFDFENDRWSFPFALLKISAKRIKALMKSSQPINVRCTTYTCNLETKVKKTFRKLYLRLDVIFK